MPLSDDDMNRVVKKFLEEMWMWITLIVFVICASGVGIVWMIWGKG